MSEEARKRDHHSVAISLAFIATGVLIGLFVGVTML